MGIQVSFDRIYITLQGGTELAISAVKLFPSEPLAEFRRAQATAQKLMGTASNSLFGFGSPGVVAAEMAAFSILTSLAAASRNKEAIANIENAKTLYAQAVAGAAWFDIHALKGGENPSPASWTAFAGMTTVEMDMDHVDFNTRQAILHKYKSEKTGKFSSVYRVEKPLDFEHDGSEIVWAKVDRGEVAIRWPHVSIYRPGVALVAETSGALVI
jgi:hypothetical protein